MNPAETLADQAPLSMDEAQEVAEELKTLQQNLLDFASRFRGRADVDQRWLAIGITDLEKGVMCLQKAILEQPLEAILAELVEVVAELQS
ncbi:Acb2/Tad1 domain-containing protein [Paracoccus sp. 22332]|uniref:Acb2/Tad1 domain-containing protein n=1 Tax=Paracoccus sp. 22332 TaxID=3453913 RepID=UPI003F827106